MKVITCVRGMERPETAPRRPSIIDTSAVKSAAATDAATGAAAAAVAVAAAATGAAVKVWIGEGKEEVVFTCENRGVSAEHAAGGEGGYCTMRT